MNLLTLPPWVKGTILFVIILICFLAFRGCQYAKNKAAENAAFKAIVDSLVKKQAYDSVVAKENAANFNASLEYANGVIALKDNQIEATRTDLNASHRRIDELLKRHKPVEVPFGDSTVVVPADYVESCAECFAELEYHKGKTTRFVKETDSLHAAHIAKENLQQNRIKQLEQENADVSQTLTACLTAANKQAKKLEPRRTMYLNMGAIGGEKNILMGIGAGLMYQDKRKRGFGFTWYGTNQGSIVTANLSFPLSFRRQ